MLLLSSAPASADDSPFANDPPLATPKPGQVSPVVIAQQRIKRYLSTLPNMTQDVVVVPAVGIMPWPLEAIEKDIKAEVWAVCPKQGNGVGLPVMMFAVRVDTGDVIALYMRNVPK